MNLLTEPFDAQSKRWPSTGRVILAQFDADSIFVYQAYSPAIGRFAAEHGYFGGDFKLDRMTWIKPNFLWMMYRSGWGTKAGQEITLAVRLKRSAFDQILAVADHSSFNPDAYNTQDIWKRQVADSDVRLQWDPDHAPDGRPVERRAIQLGLRGGAIAKFSRDWIVAIEDISDFVAEQRAGGESRPSRPGDPARGHLSRCRSRRRCPIGHLANEGCERHRLFGTQYVGTIARH
jgi:hypothetical protein